MTDRKRADFNIDQLLHPAQAFSHPSKVVNDPDLTRNEKRAILASLGRMKEAGQALVRLKETKVSVRISELHHFSFREPKYFAKYVEALRKAGFQE